MAATTGRGIKPAHPGEVLRDIWEDMDLTQAAVCDRSRSIQTDGSSAPVV